MLEKFISSLVSSAIITFAVYLPIFYFIMLILTDGNIRSELIFGSCIGFMIGILISEIISTYMGRNE